MGETGCWDYVIGARDGGCFCIPDCGWGQLDPRVRASRAPRMTKEGKKVGGLGGWREIGVLVGDN